MTKVPFLSLHRSTQRQHFWGDSHLIVTGMLRVFGMESHYFCPFRYRLGLCVRRFIKNAVTLITQKSPLGISLCSIHTQIGLLGDEHPRHFYMGAPRPRGQHTKVTSENRAPALGYYNFPILRRQLPKIRLDSQTQGCKRTLTQHEKSSIPI